MTEDEQKLEILKLITVPNIISIISLLMSGRWPPHGFLPQ